MSVYQELQQETSKLYDICLQSPFIKNLASGSLPNQAFQRYLVQDSLFLEQFSMSVDLCTVYWHYLLVVWGVLFYLLLTT